MLSYYFHKYLDMLIDLFEKGFNKNHFYFTVFITLSILILELIYVGWKNSSFKTILLFNKSTRIDFYLWMIESFNLFSFFSIALSFALCYYLVGFSPKSLNFSFSNSLVQYLVIILIFDFKNWFSHIVFHRSKLLWQIHAYHHSATNFNVFTRQRAHFLEVEFKRFFDILPFVFFGAPPSSYFFVLIFVECHQMLIHSNVESDWGFIGKHVLISPAAHKIHHSIDERHFDANFGLVFVFWDKLFRTRLITTDKITIGIPNNPYNRGIIKDVWLCQVLFIKVTIAVFKSRIIQIIRFFSLKPKGE